MSVSEMIFREKPVSLLLSLKDGGKRWYASSLARESGLSYVHATKLLNKLAEEGVVEFDNDKKMKFVSLTPKGQRIVLALEELVNKTKEERAV